MIALSLSLAYLGTLAFIAWRDHAKATRPLPPHEALVKAVEDLRRDVDAVKTWASR